MSDLLPLRSCAVLATPRAEQFVLKLARHFAKKAGVQEELPSAALITFEFGVCRLEALDGANTLRLICEAADAANQQRLHSVLDSHLALLTRQEPVQLNWELLL